MKNAVKLVAVVATAFGVAVVSERVVLVNASSYPRMLAADAGNVDQAGLERLRATTCKSEPIEVFEKKDYWVLRCGFAYYQGHTFVSHTNPLATESRR